ncbi:MAG TPA: TonB-dependent receptor [Burkholderiaceae bacterium]|jgi:outer membrane receptor protein involved in Fe transport
MKRTILCLSIASALQSAAFAAVAAPAANEPEASADVSGDSGSDSSSDKVKNTSLGTVVVTGRAGVKQRTKEETSYSVTTIDEGTLRQQAPTSVTESLKSVPGFWVESSGGEASGNVRARGIPVDGFGSITLLDDGMPVQNDPAMGYLNADQAFRLDESVDGIQVVRGGPSSIFYTNAPAGAVNYLQRKVGDKASGLVKFTAGDYGLGRSDFWFGTPVGNGLKASISGFYRQDNGIRDPGFKADQGGQVRVMLEKDWNSGSLSFDVKRLDDRVFFDLGIPIYRNSGGSLVAAPGFDGNYGTVAGPETQHLTLRTATGNFDFDNSKGTQVKRTQSTLKFMQKLDENIRFTDNLRVNKETEVRNGVYPNSVQTAGSLYTQAAPLLALYPGATQLQLRYTNAPGTLVTDPNSLTLVDGLRSLTMPVTETMNDARLSMRFDAAGTHDFTVGYYLANVNETFTRFSSSVLSDAQSNARLLDLVATDAQGKVLGSVTSNGVYQNGYEFANASGHGLTTALYLADEWQLTDKLRIDAGLRREHISLTGWNEGKQKVNLNDGQYADSQILGGTGVFTPYKGSFSKTGWTLGANYQFDKQSGVFSRWTSTFRLPSNSSYIDNPTASPIVQTMQLGEAGYKWANEVAELYATVFYTKYDNVQFTNYVSGLNGVSTNQTGFANTKTKGIEFEGGLYPVEWFDVTASVTIEQPKYENLVYTSLVNGAPVVSNFQGNQLIRVPKSSLRIVPGLNLFENKLRVQMSAEFEGKRYSDTANSVVLPAYHTLNASASYQVDKHWSLFGYVDNLNNSLGLTEGNPRAGEVQSGDAYKNVFIARPLLGRSYRAAVMYKF